MDDFSKMCKKKKDEDLYTWDRPFKYNDTNSRQTIDMSIFTNTNTIGYGIALMYNTLLLEYDNVISIAVKKLDEINRKDKEIERLYGRIEELENKK